MKNIKYDFNDILIVPEFVSTIESRKQININKTDNVYGPATKRKHIPKELEDEIIQR